LQTGRATPEVVVVGAGPAGLAVAAELRRRGLAAAVLERGDALGARWRSRYQGLRLNTYRGFSHLPGMRLPRAAGRYASRDAFIAYLEEYARRFGLDVRLEVEAQRIDQHPDGAWAVSTTAGTYLARNVVVATGWDAEPHLPAWATESSFGGQLKHASQVLDPGTFANRRVLLAGAGNTGIDLAGLLVRAGADVTISMRTPPNIFPRDWLGLPLGPTVLIAEHLPSGPIDLLGRFIQWQVYGNLSTHGIPRASEGFMTRFRRAGINPAVDDGLVKALKSGRARVVGEIERLDHDSGILKNGQHEPADAVICATGYRRGLESLVGHLGVLDPNGVPRYGDGAPCNPQTPGLYFAGFRIALSGSIRVAGRHACRIAKQIGADRSG
jgi:putative flavoprotein involved in K+ transport